jgi:hypothetical protein
MVSKNIPIISTSFYILKINLKFYYKAKAHSENNGSQDRNFWVADRDIPSNNIRK